MRTTISGVIALLAAAGCMGDRGPQGEPGDSVVVDPSLPPLEKAYAGMGGRDAIAELATLRFEVAGTRYFPGEQYAPEAPAPESHRYTATFTYDAAGDNSRT